MSYRSLQEPLLDKIEDGQDKLDKISPHLVRIVAAGRGAGCPSSWTRGAGFFLASTVQVIYWHAAPVCCQVVSTGRRAATPGTARGVGRAVSGRVTTIRGRSGS